MTTVRSTMGSSQCGHSHPSTPNTRNNSDDHVRQRRRLRARRPGRTSEMGSALGSAVGSGSFKELPPRVRPAARSDHIIQ